MSRSFKLILVLLLLSIPVGLLLRYLDTGDPKTLVGTTRFVVDGDSLYLRGQKPAIRLWGVDAPERDEHGFEEATTALRDLARRKRLRCDVQDMDVYDRAVARCYFRDGRELNRLMIETGTAKEYFYYTLGYYALTGQLDGKTPSLSPPTVKIPRPHPKRTHPARP